jgi:CRISPR system Cascade subunit CasB
MQPDTAPVAPTAKPTSPDEPSLGKTIASIGHCLAKLDPGPLAELRRAPPDDQTPRPPYFWRLVARHGIHKGDEDTWLRIIRIMAILTAKGDPEGKASPHVGKSDDNGWRGFGTTLCDGGDRAWGQGELKPRAMLSEQRFARLLAAKGAVRADLLERAARALASSKPAASQVDCTDLAKLLLYPDEPDHARSLARQYYARLDRASRPSDNADIAPVAGDNE